MKIIGLLIAWESTGQKILDIWKHTNVMFLFIYLNKNCIYLNKKIFIYLFSIYILWRLMPNLTLQLSM